MKLVPNDRQTLLIIASLTLFSLPFIFDKDEKDSSKKKEEYQFVLQGKKKRNQSFSSSPKHKTTSQIKNQKELTRFPSLELHIQRFYPEGTKVVINSIEDFFYNKQKMVKTEVVLTFPNQKESRFNAIIDPQKEEVITTYNYPRRN